MSYLDLPDDLSCFSGMTDYNEDPAMNSAAESSLDGPAGNVDPAVELELLATALGVSIETVESYLKDVMTVPHGFIHLSKQFPATAQWKELVRYIHRRRNQLQWFAQPMQPEVAQQVFYRWCLECPHEAYNAFREKSWRGKVPGELVTKETLSAKDRSDLHGMFEFYTILQTMLCLMPKENWLAPKSADCGGGGGFTGLIQLASSLEQKGEAATRRTTAWNRREQIYCYLFNTVREPKPRNKSGKKRPHQPTTAACVPATVTDADADAGDDFDGYLTDEEPLCDENPRKEQRTEEPMLVEQETSMLVERDTSSPLSPAPALLPALPGQPSGAAVSFPDTRAAEQEWLYAATEGDVAELRRIWEASEQSDSGSRAWTLNLYCKDKDQKTALIRAASSGDTPGHIEAVRFLMQLGALANPQEPGAFTNLQDPWGGHALYYACCFGHVGVIEALLSAPTTKLNSRQEHGTTPLMMAASNGQLPALLKMLSVVQTDRLMVNAVMNGGTTALMLVVIGAGGEEIQEKMVTALLQAGADASITTEAGDTAYIFACRLGKTRLAEILSPGLQFPDSSAAAKEWFQAAASGNANYLRRIWEAGQQQPWRLELHCTDPEGKTALMRAAFGGDTLGHIEAVRFLMQLGAQSNPQKPGALTNLQDQYGGHALYYACCSGHVGVINALLASPDTNLNLRQGHGTTSLMMAANNGHFPALRRMLDAARTVELDVNAVMNGGTTALMLAVIGNIPEETQEQMVAALLQAGADASIANEGGVTAYRFACQYGKTKIARILRPPL